MQGMLLGGGRGPFTPSQWMELEHQALIYKYINDNVPVPHHLLIPIRKAFESAGFCYGTKLLRPNSRKFLILIPQRFLVSRRTSLWSVDIKRNRVNPLLCSRMGKFPAWVLK